MIVFFAILLPLLLIIGSVVVTVGSWYTHGKHLQTKVDAAAFASGVSWAFPCGTTIDANIEDFARQYLGAHVKADGNPYSSTPYNPQVGKVPGSQIHGVLNGPSYYDGDSNPNPTEKTAPAGSICAARTLDVKGTEENSPLLWGWLPFWPDIKKKARIEIQEGKASAGLLPIAVRVPKPVSAAAIFFNEEPGPNFGTILAARPMCEAASVPGLPAGLGGWTTLDVTNTQGPNNTSICPSWTSVNVPSTAGVAIALSFRRSCAAAGTGPCLNVPGGYTNVNQLCNQVTPGGVPLAQCYFGTGNSPSQSMRSGLQFVRGYGAADPDPQPDLQGVWLDGAGGTNCYPYFSSPVVNQCTATLHAQVDPGPATTGNVEVRYKMVSGNIGPDSDDAPGPCGNNYQPQCELSAGWQTSVTFDPQYARHAFAIQVRLQNVPNPQILGLPQECGNSFNNLCRWFFTGAGRTTNEPTDVEIFENPVQRQFMGDIDLSGPIKWLYLGADKDCNGVIDDGLGETGQAASVPAGNRCFFVDMGLQGAIPQDQDVQPIAFNISTTSQHQLLDCDPTIPQGQVDDAIAKGCGPWYASHDFVQTPLCPDQNVIFNLPQPAPWQDWDPKTCVKTRPTTSGNQIAQGFNMRFFGNKNNPTCPTDVAPGTPGFQWGRNYWNDANNANDTVTKTINGVPVTYQTTYTEQGPTGAHDYAIPEGDPRLVTLFFTPYNSFGNSGQETYPVVGLGRFYITGYGRAGQIDDPCNGGNSSGVPGAGSLPPPDLNFGNNYFVWGHFVKDVVLSNAATPSGVLCDPASLQPCVATLVE